jgi:hypothetical protein
MQGECRADCEAGEGALVCDSNYVDHGDNLAECVNALKAQLNITVQGYANASCEGNTCEAEAGASCECGLSKGTAAGSSALLWSLGLLGMVMAMRRRRRALAR